MQRKPRFGKSRLFIFVFLRDASLAPQLLAISKWSKPFWDISKLLPNFKNFYNAVVQKG
jgi:hypothetical protein